MAFKITQDNIETVLEQYSGNKQPGELVGCYDANSVGVAITAPGREEMQRAVFEYDIKHHLGNKDLQIDMNSGRLYVAGKTIYDADDCVLGDLHDIVSAGAGVTLFTDKREFTYLTSARAAGDLSRITAVFPVASNDEGDYVGEFSAFGKTIRFKLDVERIDGSLTHYNIIPCERN